jgi:hypothetical protein
MLHLLETFFPSMSPYERWRVFLGIVQVIATLGAPFVVIALDRLLKHRKRRKRKKI